MEATTAAEGVPEAALDLEVTGGQYRFSFVRLSFDYSLLRECEAIITFDFNFKEALTVELHGRF